MDEKAKKRLVGAVVLVSLAVIFIPMLLEERTPSEMPTFGSNVPAGPDESFEVLDIPLRLPEPPSARQQTVVETEAEATRLEEAVANEEPEPAPEPVAAKPEQEEPPPAAAPEPPPPSDGPKGWVVQVGSFREPANAFRLRDKLRGQGFPAFVEQLRSGESIAYRVRVGPELLRERAEKLKTDLAGRLELDGLVMSHP